MLPRLLQLLASRWTRGRGAISRRRAAAHADVVKYVAVFILQT
jgi:hypothetical protein